MEGNNLKEEFIQVHGGITVSPSWQGRLNGCTAEIPHSPTNQDTTAGQEVKPSYKAQGLHSPALFPPARLLFLRPYGHWDHFTLMSL